MLPQPLGVDRLGEASGWSLLTRLAMSMRSSTSPTDLASSQSGEVLWEVARQHTHLSSPMKGGDASA